MAEHLAGISVHFPAGVVPVPALRLLAEIAEARGSNRVRIGSRQDLLLPDVERGMLPAELPGGQGWIVESDEAAPGGRLTSSIAAVGLGVGTPWLDATAFNEVIDGFERRPALPVHVADPRQWLEPTVTGRLNFLADTIPGMWQAWHRLSGQGARSRMPWLIPGPKIAEIAHSLDHADAPPASMIERLSQACGLHGFHHPLGEDEPGLDLPGKMHAACMEGVQSMQDAQRFWIGIFYDEPFIPAMLLRELCMDATRLGVGTLYLTHARTLLIKDVPGEDVATWRRLLAARRVRLRHDDLALRWQVPAGSPELETLRLELLADLRHRQVVNPGLSIALTDDPGTEYSESAIVIRRRGAGGFIGRLARQEEYDLGYRPAMNERDDLLLSFGAGLRRGMLGRALGELIGAYCEDRLEHRTAEPGAVQESPGNPTAHQCADCGTIYDPEYGDAWAGLNPGLAFDDLAGEWSCPVCGQSRAAFHPVAAG